MEIYVVKISIISIFLSFFWFSTQMLPDALLLPVSQLQLQRVMTSQIRSHILLVLLYTYIKYWLILFLCSFCSWNWWTI